MREVVRAQEAFERIRVHIDGQSWCGALPEITPLALLLLFVTRIFITDRVNKIPLVLSFLGAYYLLVTITAFAGQPAKVAVVSYAVFELIGAAYFLLAGLLAANAWEAWRRWRTKAA